MNKAAPPDVENLLRRTYAAFNARDVNAVLGAMHQHIDWPNMVEGTRAHGHDEVRAYWSWQFRQIDPHVEPKRISADAAGRMVVEVHQVIRSKDGSPIDDRVIQHIYTMRDGLIVRMDVVSG